MESDKRRQQGEIMKAEHEKNHLANLKIFHGWLGKVFFFKGVRREPVKNGKLKSSNTVYLQQRNRPR